MRKLSDRVSELSYLFILSHTRKEIAQLPLVTDATPTVEFATGRLLLRGKEIRFLVSKSTYADIRMFQKAVNHLFK